MRLLLIPTGDHCFGGKYKCQTTNQCHNHDANKYCSYSISISIFPYLPPGWWRCGVGGGGIGSFRIATLNTFTMGPASSFVRRRRQEQYRYQRRCLAIFVSLAIVLYLRVTVKVHTSSSQTLLVDRGRELELDRETFAHSSQSQHYVHPATIDTIVNYLTKLAELPPPQLWNVLGLDDESQTGDDPFSLRLLESGKCPWQTETIVPWLPSRPHNSGTIAEMYRKNMESVKKDGQPPTEGHEEGNEVAIWYEHLSVSVTSIWFSTL